MAKIIILIGVLIVLFMGIMVGLSFEKIDVANAYIQCCNGSQCTDTYYTSEDNLCHLVLCENSMFTNKKDCVYQGLNVSINVT